MDVIGVHFFHNQIKNLDLGTIQFESKNSYKLAIIGESKNLTEGEKVFVNKDTVETPNATLIRGISKVGEVTVTTS